MQIIGDKGLVLEYFGCSSICGINLILHPGVNPSNMTTTLQPTPIMTRKVSDVIDTKALGYIYA